MTTVDPATHTPLVPTRELEADQRAVNARRARLVGRVSLAAPLFGAAAGALFLLRDRHSRGVGLGLLGASLGFGLVRWQLQRFFTESGDYRLVARLGDIELRSYPAQVWAQTRVEQATWSDTLETGFKRLAGYIFGDNASATRLSMTAPVVSSLPFARGERGERLSMTAPVHATLGDTDYQDAVEGRDTGIADRTVSFVMPGDRDITDLPTPRDSRVQLRAVPERVVAVLAFTGDYKGSLPADKRSELVRRLREAGLTPQGEASFAGYDPPSTLPALRRNEVMIELEDA